MGAIAKQTVAYRPVERSLIHCMRVIQFLLRQRISLEEFESGPKIATWVAKTTGIPDHRLTDYPELKGLAEDTFVLLVGSGVTCTWEDLPCAENVAPWVVTGQNIHKMRSYLLHLDHPEREFCSRTLSAE